MSSPSSSPGEDILKIERLKKRPDFLAAARGLNCARGAVVAQARDRQDFNPLIRIGFTATRRVGNAVARNRCKRRLREAARFIAPLYAVAGCDYVFIARGGTAKRAWAALIDDMTSALTRLAADLRTRRDAIPGEFRDPSFKPPANPGS